MAMWIPFAGIGGVGRPELLYRLTNKAHDLFPKEDNALVISLLEQVAQALRSRRGGKGALPPFSRKDAELLGLGSRGETLAERAKWLVRLRDREGHMAEFAEEPSCASSNAIIPWSS